MSFEVALAAMSAGTALAAVAGSLAAFQARRRAERVAESIKRQAEIPLTGPSDPQDLNAYLFRNAGPLSIREYATDPDVRTVVERAIARVDDLIESPRGRREEYISDEPLPPQIPAARFALTRGDLLGALAWMRLGVELALKDRASISDVGASRFVSASSALRSLAQSGQLDRRQASDLAYAIRVANEGLHGGPIEASQVEEALVMASRALAQLHGEQTSDSPE